MATTWIFSALDTLFFRDGQPMNMGESAWIDSRFPPTGITLQGAVRAAVLDHLKADVRAFQQGDSCLSGDKSLKAVMGDATGIGPMRLSGPFLHYRGEPWLPVPLDLVRTRRGELTLLRPRDEAVRCDLGRIRLPAAPAEGKPLGGRYLPRSALARLLRGEARLESDEHLPLLADAPTAPGLADREPKIGLARDNRTRTNLRSMLYAIAPIRPRPGVTLRLGVEGLEKLDAEWHPKGPFPQLLGGEKRLARVEIREGAITWPPPALQEQEGRLRFKLVLITPALFPPPGWLPAGFEKQRRAGFDCWHGKMGSATFDILGAAVGHPERIGGWNLKENRSHELKSYLPAGSVLFCEAEAKQRQAVEALHDTHVGEMTEYGFGHVLIGQW